MYEHFVHPFINWENQDIVSVILVEDKQVFISLSNVTGNQSMRSVAICFLGIDDFSEEVVGACLQCVH